MEGLNTPLVTVDWLYSNLNLPNLLVLDGSMKQVNSDSHEESNIQITNALFFDIKNTFSNINAEFPNTVPSVEQFTDDAQKLGINEDSVLIVYDDKGIYSSARVWWLFKAFGFTNIAVLDGGLPQWNASNYKTETKKNRAVPKGNFEGKYNSKYFRFFKDILEIQDDTSCLILDARSTTRFKGEIEEPRTGLRSGNIPNSKNLPYTYLFDGYCLKPKNELKLIFKTLMEQQDKLIFSCGSGITACILALAADSIGINNLSVYDGSWTEYGSLTT